MENSSKKIVAWENFVANKDFYTLLYSVQTEVCFKQLEDEMSV